jgi:leukotriene-A4 hydrolase
VGTEAFEAFAKAYFAKYKFGTVTSEEFRVTLLEHFQQDPRLVGLPWNDLFYKPGLPPSPRFDIAPAEAIEKLADCWYDGQNLGPKERSATGESQTKWSTLQKQIFLERLLSRAEKSGPMKVPVLGQIDASCQFSASKNSEIRFRWSVLCLRAGTWAGTNPVLPWLWEEGS